MQQFKKQSVLNYCVHQVYLCLQRLKKYSLTLEIQFCYIIDKKLSFFLVYKVDILHLFNSAMLL